MGDPFTLLAILGAVLLGAMSPGPSFVFVVRTSLAGSRAGGVAAAAGMALGGTTYSVLALLGLRSLLERVPELYTVLKVAGGLYLLVLAVRIWASAKRPLDVPGTGAGPTGLARPFLLALGTQLSNPKTALVYGSIFAALLPAGAPASWLVALPVLVFAIEGGWYALVALAFSSAPSRAAYLRSKRWVDRAAGGVLGALGVALMLRRNPA